MWKKSMLNVGIQFIELKGIEFFKINIKCSKMLKRGLTVYL